MIKLKLFVILIFVITEAKSSEYCKICLNHTLCKYPIPGPSHACTGYDASALLSLNNIIDILDRVNERRNFIALGLSKRFPAAGNMRKITWSEDLAWSAQRWVDQCDPNVRPDKHDLCRNIENKVVGQNIATIFGPSPGLSVKSFVDIWFMQSIDYYGEVSYYNRSQDAKTEYFTQLVWAKTNSIGCGKARFHLNKTVVERLVCNFAPSGNINGKPVYALGIAATQCSDGCNADEVFTGLCSCQPKRKFTLQSPLASSLLRILNLENNSTKQEIDPLKYSLKQTSTDDVKSKYQRHHKSRHVVNNSQAELSQLIHGVPMMNNFNDSRNFIQHYYQPDKEQSRVYHGYNHRNNFIPPYTSSTEENFRRFDLITQPLSPPHDPQASNNYRRLNQCNQCTRRSPVIVNCNSPAPCVTDRCTRGQINDCRAARPCISLVQYPHVQPHNKCGCSSHTTCPPSISSSCCEVTCRCPCHATTSSPCCPNARRAEDPVTKGETRLSSEIHYYDLFPNLSRRSGDLTREKLPNKGVLSTDRKMWLLHDAPYHKDKNQVLHKRKENPTLKNNEQVSMKIELPHYIDEDLDYSYGSFDSRKRLNREPDNKTYWQINKNENKQQRILKSLQYTTLKNRKSWRNINNITKHETATEPMAIERKSYEEDNEHNHIQHNKEKFLSFEELMRLRKTNTGELNFRRAATQTKSSAPTPTIPSLNKPTQNKPTNQQPKPIGRADSTLTTVPANYTMMTSFARKKYCTRRLTCTWTVFTATASDGSILNPGINAGGGGGSRTPPGYVEGCTRTSTCTRDFMNRNRISTLPMTTLPDEQTLEDEDYCERRSLNVEKRSFDEPPARIFKRQESLENMVGRFIVANHTKDSEKLSKETKNNIIAEHTRKKRNSINDESNMRRCDHCSLKKKDGQYKNPLLSYGDLYYLVLSKLTKLNENEKKTNKCRKCPCNAGSKQSSKKSIKFVWIFLTINKIFS